MDISTLSLKDLVDKINKDLGNDFCDIFRYKRKELSNSGRASSYGILFKFVEDGRDWVINEGGGTEIQFHLYYRENTIGYGLGFNAQYVPFANEKTPVEYIMPFIKAFLSLKSKKDKAILSLEKDGFSLIEGDWEGLNNIALDEYYLYGKEIQIHNGTLPDSEYNQMIENIKNELFNLYVSIWREKNEMEKRLETMEQYTNLLTKNYNLILTGAPGTGKTYLAKQIAQQMIFGEVKEKMTDEEKKQFDEQYGFVQFHPSYDYTDFVEGLRPKQEDNRNIGFERKDGIFKEFCKRAIGGKTREIIAEEVSAGEVQNVYRWYADTDDSDFGRIYKSLLKDVAAGKLNGLNFGGSYYRLGISRTGKLCIPDESIDRTINEGTLKRLYDHLAKDNWKNLDESSSYYFRIAEKTLNYTHYRAVLQEMKNRKEKEGDLLGDKVVISEHTLSSNPVDSDSSVDTSIPAKENDIDEAMKNFKDYVKEAGEKGVTINYLNSSGDFTVYMGDNDSLRVKIANGNTHHTSPMNIKKYITTKDADDDTYDSSIGQYIIDHYMNDAGNEDSDEEENPIVSDNTGNKPFVFIIDEINRGEISKIFGELFFSIDPGYRGEKGIVQTQYQNMVEGGDAFKKGFFVPENVYIIGTMNDIDRSVESMDFAFRRRFAFKEVTDEDSQEMLDNEDAWKDSNGNSLKPDDETIKLIKGKMESLNKMIWHEEKENEKEEDKCIEGLSSAYHIGASYFLKLKNYKSNNGKYDNNSFDDLWKYHLKGLLFEYLRGMQGVEDSMNKLKRAYDSNNTTTNGSDSNNG